MIFIVRKNIYRDKIDTVVKNCLGEDMFVVKPIKGAYLVFNKEMLEIAEIKFDKAVTFIKIAQTEDQIIIDMNAPKNIVDENKLLNIIGDIDEYIYDGYYGNKTAFQMVTSSENLDYYQVKVLEGNALKFILISLALEKMCFDQKNKK